jgi:hypothetical protein
MGRAKRNPFLIFNATCPANGVAFGGTSHPGYRPMPKNATIPAGFGFMGESICSNTLQGKQ